MIIKLTNANSLYAGKPLLINTDYIVSVFEAELEGKKITMIYAETKDTWQVKETVAQIYKMIGAYE